MKALWITFGVVAAVIVITVIFVLVDKQTLMRFGLDQQKYAIHCRRN